LADQFLGSGAGLVLLRLPCKVPALQVLTLNNKKTGTLARRAMVFVRVSTALTALSMTFMEGIPVQASANKRLFSIFLGAYAPPGKSGTVKIT